MQPLPTYARRRIDDAAPMGVIEAIQVRPARRAPMLALEAWDLTERLDRARSEKRALTLIQHEHLEVVASLLGAPVSFEETRRNISVRRFNLEAARGRALQLGSAIVEITGRCHPCGRMEETLGPGGFTAMFGHGGFTARIVTPGVLRVGDSVELHPHTAD